MKNLLVVFADAFDKLTPQEKVFLQLKLNDPIFQKFIQLQEQAAREHATTLNPNVFTDAQALEYLNQARSLKLVEFFWQELGAFTTAWSTKARSQGG